MISSRLFLLNPVFQQASMKPNVQHERVKPQVGELPYVTVRLQQFISLPQANDQMFSTF